MIAFLADPDEYTPWLAPYVFTLMILAILAFLFKIFQNWYSIKYHKPLYRDVFFSKTISAEQVGFLHDQFPFYSKLSKKHQKRFRHRIATFISKKEFVGMEGFDITDEIILFIAAHACMLSFGRKNYLYKLVDTIVIFPEEFQSELRHDFRIHEFNPKRNAIVFSWSDIMEKLTAEPKRNFILFEFMHAMQLEAKFNQNLDSRRLEVNYQTILQQLIHPEFKERLEKSLLKDHPFSNEFEFMAVLGECFFENSVVFQTVFPELYMNVKRILGYDFKEFER